MTYQVYEVKSLKPTSSICSLTTERDKDEFDENCWTMLHVAMAAFTLAVKTKVEIQVLLIMMKWS